MTNINIPKARLLTLRELIGVDDPKQLGITASTTYEQLESISDETDDKLSIFKKRGILCEAAYGHRCPGQYDNVCAKDGNNLSSPSGYLIDSKCSDRNGRPLMIDAFGKLRYIYGTTQWNKLRVAFTWSEIKDYCQNITRAEDGVLEADYGLWIINDPAHYWIEDSLLDPLYSHLDEQTLLSKLPLTYTVIKVHEELNATKAEYPVYEFQGEKYVRKPYSENNCEHHNWTTLKPIHLWIDEETDTAVSENTLLRYLSHNHVTDFLDEHFSKDVFRGALYLRQSQKESDSDKEGKTMFPGIAIVEPPKAESSSITSGPRIEPEKEKPMFPGISKKTTGPGHKRVKVRVINRTASNNNIQEKG